MKKTGAQIILKKLIEHNICLIFDEVQTGFGVTGTMWYYQHVGIIPDIVVFGKKSQVSGIMAVEEYNNTFRAPVRLEVTWDGDLTDMVRGKYVLRAYKQYNVLENVQKRSMELVSGLQDFEQLRNIRSCGLLIAFDFVTQRQRDIFFDNLVKNKMTCNKTRDKTIRLRPNLNITSSEVREALDRIKMSLN